MIYINQIGQCELGRGETLDAAIADAKKWGFEITLDEVRRYSGWGVCDGELVWCIEPMVGYNS